jgi:ABC-type transporter Mla maintaining outer membrane lipid asymmetry ATPase subunit MlaF
MADRISRPRSRAHSRSRRIPVNVGEDITAPFAVARDGRIPIRTERAAAVARWFGLSRAEEGTAPVGAGGSPRASTRGYAGAPGATAGRTIVPPAAGTVLLITGPSGAGKSTLLRALRQQITPARPWIDLAEVAPAPAGANEALPLVDCFGPDAPPLRDVLLLLSRVGLGEAWSYLRPPAELSEGQRWRFRLALALHAATGAARGMGASRGTTVTSVTAAAAAPVLACDEFAAVLDRVTAMVVARCLRRAVDADPRLAAVVATSHDDLQPALRPDVIAYCDFGRVEWRNLR